LANLTKVTRKKLGEMLLEAGLLNAEQIEDALNEQKRTGELLGDILIRRGAVSELNIAQTIATQYNLPYLSPSQYVMSADVVQSLPMEFQSKCLIFPLDRFGNTLVVAAACPLTNDVLEELQQVSGCSVQIYVGTPTDVREAIDRGSDLLKRTVFTEATQLADEATDDVDQAELEALQAALEKELDLGDVDIVQEKPGHKEGAEQDNENGHNGGRAGKAEPKKSDRSVKRKISRFGRGE